MAQEILTLAQAADFMLMGKIAAAADVVCQRIKSLEAVAKGSHWSTGRQLELVRRDQFAMAEGSEAPWSSKESEGRGETPQSPGQGPLFEGWRWGLWRQK